MEEYKKIELRSTEVQEILSRPPKWMVRWGITIIFLVILIVIVGSWFFKYPDIITAKIVLTTENPPAPVVAKASGKIQNLFVKEQQYVEKDQVLAIIENPAEYGDVFYIKEKLELFGEKLLANEFFLKDLKRNLNLGSVQSQYADFMNRVDDYQKMKELDYYQKKIGLLIKEKNQYQKYFKNLQTQRDLQKAEYVLLFNQYKRDSVLHSQQFISDAEFEKSKSGLLSKQFSYEQSNIALTNAEIQIQNIEQNIAEMELQEEKQYSEKQLYIMQSYENLMATIDSWKYQYMLVATTNGKITFNQYWNENQTVKAGETVMTIIPEKEGEIIGKVQLTFDGAGKVKSGQMANIQFANYPYMEFGMVKGIVKNISLAPENDYYTAEIELPEGLKTFYGMELQFKQQMQGSVEIITEDIRLMERIIRPLRYILKRNTNL